MIIKRLVLGVACLALCAGCMNSAKKEDVVYVETSVNRELGSIRQDMSRLEASVEENNQYVMSNQSTIEERLSALEKANTVLRDRVLKNEERIAELASSTQKAQKQLQTQFGQSMDSLLDTIVAENQKLVQQINKRNAAVSAAASSSSRSSGGTVTGFYHTVERGQSLSKIAAMYDVGIETILTENEITDPNKIRVGMQIFIPQDER